MRENRLTIKAAAGIAGTAPSVIQGWKDGAMPSETVGNLKKLCNTYGYSLSFALTGDADEIEGSHPLQHFVEDEWFDGYARIKIMKLVPRRGQKT